jgi:hypothetical protein
MKTGMDVQVGDEVFVKPASYGRGGVPLVPAKVTVTSQTWAYIERTDGGSWPETWRLRRDTQNEGRDSVYQASFLTPEQVEAQQQLSAADACLAGQGIDIRYDSRWRSPSQRIALATAISILATELDKIADGESAGGAR